MDELRKHIAIMRNLCHRLDRTGLGLKLRSGGKLDTETSFVTDLMLFMVALSNGDGTIDRAEAEAIGRNLGFDATPEKVRTFIDRQSLSDWKLSPEEMPLTLQVFAEADQDSLQSQYESLEDGTAPELYDEETSHVPLSIILYEVYREIGSSVIYSDEQVDECENEDYNSFLAAMKQYICNELGLTVEQFEDKINTLEEDET